MRQLRRCPLLYYWLPLIGWMGIIFWFSSQPEPFALPQSWQQELVGKAGHLIGYAGLGVLWWRALQAHRFTSQPQKLAFVLTVLYAIFDEYHQTFVPGRNGSTTDVLIDATGAALGLWLLCRRQGGTDHRRTDLTKIP
jgi:VanZ family protein